MSIVTENFLINPPGKLSKSGKKNSIKKRKKKGLPSSLLKKMIKKYGPTEGMKEAWKTYNKSKSGGKKVKIKRKTHRPVLYEKSPKVWIRSSHSKSKKAGIILKNKKKNPFGEEVVIVGLNPKKRSKRRSRRRNALSINSWFGHPRLHSRASKLGWKRRKKKYKTHRRSKRMRYNPLELGSGIAVKNRKRRRKNVPKILGMDIMKNLPLMGVGAGSIIVTSIVPTFVKATTPLMKYGVQLGTAIGGGAAINMVQKNKAFGLTWMITGSAVILSDIVKSYLLKGMFGISDYGAYPEEISAYPEEVSAYPEEVSAYPEEVSDVYDNDEIFEAYPDFSDSEYPL